MSVYKRGGVWWYEFVFNGERIRESTKQSNKRVAEQIEAARKTELAKGEVGIESRKRAPTLKEFAPRFMAAVEARRSEKPRTVEFYRSKLNKLLSTDWLAARRIDAIDEAAVERYVQERRGSTTRFKRPLSPASLNRELATLKRLLRLAQEWREIDRVPSIHMQGGERNRDFILSLAAQPSYFAACPSPLRDVATLLVETGLRLGEALSLDWEQVRLVPAPGAKFGYITVLPAKAKSGKSRNVPLSAAATVLLSRLQPQSSGYVFCRDDGSPFSNSFLGQQHARVRKAMKLPKDFVLHSLRHTFGTRLGESGADAFTIMKLMGHSTVTVSQRYVHPSPEAVENAFERMMATNVPTNLPTAAVAVEGNLAQVV